MELLTPQGWSAFLVESAHIGFFVFTVICLFLRLIRGSKISRQAVNVQYCANLILAILTVFEILMWSELYYELHTQNEYEQFILLSKGFYVKGYGSVIMACLVLYWIGALLFFIPRLRVSWLLSLLVLVLMNVDAIIALIPEDYVSPELLTYENDWLLNGARLLAFAALTFLVYFIFYKRKKLPHR